MKFSVPLQTSHSDVSLYKYVHKQEQNSKLPGPKFESYMRNLKNISIFADVFF